MDYEKMQHVPPTKEDPQASVRATKHGHFDVQYKVGLMYEQGVGVRMCLTISRYREIAHRNYIYTGTKKPPGQNNYVRMAFNIFFYPPSKRY